MRTFSEELASVIEQRFGLQHMQAMIDLPSYPPIPLNEDEQLQTGEMQGGQEADAVVVKCLQQAGIIPATLDVFKPSCTLHINYKSALELKIGDCVFLRQMSEGPPNVAILKNYQDQSASSLQGTTTTTLFTLMMVALDSESKDGAQYLHWILANISNQYLTSSAGVGNELVVYESPKPKIGRTHNRYLFVAYAQQQPLLHLLWAPIKRSNFNLRSFATAHAFNSPVAALYIIAAPNP